MNCKVTLLLLGFLASGCASTTDPESRSKARSAAYAADGFYIDNPKAPHRPAEPFQFYYKHCSLETRSPAPRGGEFDCTPP